MLALAQKPVDGPSAPELTFWERMADCPQDQSCWLDYARWLAKNGRAAEAGYWEELAGLRGTRNRVGGFFSCQKFRSRRHAEHGLRPLGFAVGPNLVPTVGLNHALSITLAAGTQVTTWYAGLVANSGFSAFAAGDTMSSHAGWTEDQNYTEANRQTWTPGAVSGGVVSNSTSMNFTMNATTTIKGGFLVSNNTKGGTSGTLFAEGAFSANQAMSSGQVLKITYTSTATSS